MKPHEVDKIIWIFNTCLFLWFLLVEPILQNFILNDEAFEVYKAYEFEQGQEI